MVFSKNRTTIALLRSADMMTNDHGCDDDAAAAVMLPCYYVQWSSQSGTCAVVVVTAAYTVSALQSWSQHCSSASRAPSWSSWQYTRHGHGHSWSTVLIHMVMHCSLYRGCLLLAHGRRVLRSTVVVVYTTTSSSSTVLLLRSSILVFYYFFIVFSVFS